MKDFAAQANHNTSQSFYKLTINIKLIFNHLIKYNKLLQLLKKKVQSVLLPAPQSAHTSFPGMALTQSRI